MKMSRTTSTFYHFIGKGGYKWIFVVEKIKTSMRQILRGKTRRMPILTNFEVKNAVFLPYWGVIYQIISNYCLFIMSKTVKWIILILKIYTC